MFIRNTLATAVEERPNKRPLIAKDKKVSLTVSFQIMLTG
jgi:hypothetical protein